MRSRVGFVALVVGIVGAASSPGLTQVMPGSATSAGDIWQTGTASSPGLSSARQTPNLQPTTPAQPAGSQASTTASPSWYPQPQGTPFNGGTLYSAVTAGAFYDDNIFATHTNQLHDWAFFERPEAQWVQRGQNYTFTADGFVEARQYARFSSEDQVNGGAGAGFTETPDNNTQIIGSVRYLRGHLDRGSSETVVTIPGAGTQLLSTLFAHPVAYDEGLASFALNKRYGNWWSSLGAAGLEIEYQNASIASNSIALAGTPVDFSYADGAIATMNARLGYVVMPLTSLFMEAAANTRDWHVGYFDSSGYRVVGGMLFEQGPGARLKGEVWAGYMGQRYGGITLSNVSSWTFGLNMAALITDDVTAVFEGRREAKEAALGLAALSSGALGATAGTCVADGFAANAAVCVSDIESEIGGRLDYRIYRNVVIGGGVTYQEDDYQGPLSFGRVDRSLGPLASVKYFASPNVTLGFDYRKLAFTSSGGAAPAPFIAVAALPYNRNIFLFTLNAKW
jgi:hypothetical protein